MSKNLERAERRRRARLHKAEKNAETNEFYWSLFDSRCGALMLLLAGIFVEKMLVVVLYDFFEGHREGLKMLCETVYLQENVFSQDVLEKFSWLNTALAQQANIAREWWYSDMLRYRSISRPEKPVWVLKFEAVLSRFKKKFSYYIALHKLEILGEFLRQKRIILICGGSQVYDICAKYSGFICFTRYDSIETLYYHSKIRQGMITINRNPDGSLILTDKTPIFVSQNGCPISDRKLTTVGEFVRDFTP
jgi:hypothetical protein